MAPKVPAKRKQEEEDKAAEAKKAKPEEEKKEEEQKFQEPDAPKDNRPTIKEQVRFATPETTLNVVQTLGGKLLTCLSEGGMSAFLAGARANVGQKAGRYMFEAKIVESMEGQGGKNSGKYLRIGFSTSSSSLFLGEDATSVCFDSEGFFYAGKKKQQVKGNARINSHQDVAVVLNLDPSSPNQNTVALYRDGAAVGEPMPLPEELKDQPLFPHVTFRSVSLAINFGPTAVKDLPFKCRLIGGAANSDCTITPSQEPKDGKYEVLMPVAFPDEGTFDWLDSFLEKNPQYYEISDRKILKWAHASGLFAKGKGSSNDKPDLNFGLQGQDGGSLRKALGSIAPLVPRNYLIMEVKSNLIAAERKEVVKKFNYPCYKKVAQVVMGPPNKEFKAVVQNKLLKDKQQKADNAFKAKKAEAARKKAAEQRAKEIAKKKEEAKKKQEAAKAAKDGEKKDEEEKKEEEVKEAEEAKVEEEDAGEPPVVELDDDEKQLNFTKKSVPDLAPEVLSRNFAKFSTPDADEGFDDIRYEWLKGDKAVNYLKKWVVEKKLTTRVDDIKPGQDFRQKNAEFEKLMKGWKEKAATGKKSKEGENTDIDIFTVDDISDIGGGIPLFEHFGGEDWMLTRLRFEFAMLVLSFKKDIDDPDRVGIPLDHLNFYYSKYFNKGINTKLFGASDTAEVLSLVKDTVSTKDNLLVSQLTDDIESMDIFVKLTEEGRRERCRRIEAGDETARLKFTAPKESAAPKPAAQAPKPAPAAKLGATAAPKAGGKK